jgi:hypothetical protein
MGLVSVPKRYPITACPRLVGFAPLFPLTDFGEVKGQEHVKRASKWLLLEAITYILIGQKAGYFSIPFVLAKKTDLKCV